MCNLLPITAWSDKCVTVLKDRYTTDNNSLKQHSNSGTAERGELVPQSGLLVISGCLK